MKKHLFLHIGMKKVASTTIQIFLEKNAEKLLDRGYLFPWGLRRRHRALSFASKNMDVAHARQASNNTTEQYSGIWTEFYDLADSSACDRIILSSESFESSSPRYIQSLYKRLNRYQTKVVIYIRRQDLRLESHYLQDVKSGVFTGTIEAYLKDYRYETLDYFDYIKRWASVFGHENMIVRNLEKSQSSDVCTGFLNAIGITAKPKTFQALESNQNTKPNLAQMSAIKIINDSVATTHGRTQEGLSRLDLEFDFNSEYTIPFFELSKDWQSPQTYKVLPYKSAQSILARYQASNQKVAKQYLSRPDGVLFYDDIKPTYDVCSLESSNLDHDKLIEVCSFLHKKGTML